MVFAYSFLNILGGFLVLMLVLAMRSNCALGGVRLTRGRAIGVTCWIQLFADYYCYTMKHMIFYGEKWFVV